MPKSTRTFRAPSATATVQRARPLSLSPASDDDIDDLTLHSRPHRPRHDPTATKRVTVRKTPDQVRALNIAFHQLGARPSQSDRRRLALEIGLSERIVNTWFRDERSKRKKEGMAASRAQATVAAAATHPRLSSAKARGPSDDADETDMENEDDELMDDDDEPLDPPPRKPDNNTHSEPVVSVYAHPGSSTPYHPHPPLYGYAAYQEKEKDSDLVSNRSFPQVSPPLAVRQLNGTRIRNMVPEQLRTHRALHTSGAAPTDHLLSPAYLPSELSSISEHDGERMFDALSHSPMTNIEPSPVRSEMSLPATPLQNEGPLPISLPPVGSLTHPPEGGWTSSWRWSFYGHTSSMRATLEPAKWSPESSDGESVLGLENINPISIRVSDYDKYDKPFDAGVKRSPFAPTRPH